MPSSSSTSSSAYPLIWNKISSIKIAMLVVTDPSGRLYSSPLTTLQKDFSGAIWFFVSASSEAVRATRASPEVNLAYIDHEKDLYVSLSGRALIDPNLEKREEFFNVFTKAWFPQGLSDPDLVLLRIDVHSAEYWDVKENKAIQLLKIAKAAATGSRPTSLGEHGNVRLG